jgi:hypothetical protein
MKKFTQDTKEQSHLTEKQQKELADMLLKHEPLFDGTLGCYPLTNNPLGAS